MGLNKTMLRLCGGTEKQPNKGKQHESMGTLANTDDKEGLLSEYQKFRNAEAAEEAAAEGDE